MRARMLDRPIFISGLRKSGTSMVLNLFDGHPDLFVTPWNEVHFFKFTHYRHALMQIKGERKPIADRVDDICNDRWFNPIPQVDAEGNIYVPERSETLDYDAFKAAMQRRKTQIGSYRDLFEAMQLSMAEAAPHFSGRDIQSVRFVCKGVQQTEFVPELCSWFPDIKFIYVLRNPYAQLNSAINNMRHSKGGLVTKHAIANEYRKLDGTLPYPYLGRRIKQMKWSYFFAMKFADLYPDNFYILNYDRLLAGPEEEMRAVARFTELEFHPVLLRVTMGGKPLARAGWSVGRHENEGEISTKPLTAWREQLPDLAIRLVNFYFADELDHFGFQRVGSKAPRWKRFDRSEGIRTYVANRFLFSRSCRNLLVG